MSNRVLTLFSRPGGIHPLGVVVESLHFVNAHRPMPRPGPEAQRSAVGGRMEKMLWRKPIFLGFLLITMVSGAHAQNRFEIEPFVGARFGGRITINTPAVDYLTIDTSLNWGFTTGVAIVRHLFAEFMWNRQTPTLSAHDIPLNQTLPLTTRAHIDLYHFDLLY